MRGAHRGHGGSFLYERWGAPDTSSAPTIRPHGSLPDTPYAQDAPPTPTDRRPRVTPRASRAATAAPPRQAYERGYQVVFGSDVTATDDASRPEPELAVLRKGFALVLTAREIEDELRSP
ncbi:cysteine hydrolase family protein [Streptomyces cavernicola]|uniref:Isochorismatase-like domain-containing protein n=1 Tax=Streptomyces cavernicola TaxID=3043613 RepID=A0ABT6SFH9_9ACTN|nr:hypothetical protein [Streptomyces sp. B-S-A6]MDI3406725.1 hypothetical protein [Streptomyces sp. B-S-A6]